MKKFFLCVGFAVFSLTACSSGVTDLKPVSAGQNIKHVCLKGSIKAAPDNFIEALTRSLKNKNISAELMKNKVTCDHVLFFNVRGNSNIIARAKFELKTMETKQSLGSLSYKRRGDEKERVDQVGLQGQTDLMINQLFQ